MKTANVVAVRDVTPEPVPETPEAEAADAMQARLGRMAERLRRYPCIDEAERDELLRFLKTGSVLEIGLLSARDGVAPNLMRFRKDHAEAFRLSPLQILGFAALSVGPFLLLAWLCFG